MLTPFEWFCILSILAATFAGGYYPLLHRDRARAGDGLPLGEAFTSGIFIALALLLMLSSSLHLLGSAFPSFDFPFGALIAVVAFLGLLGLELRIDHMRRAARVDDDGVFPAYIPLIMTAMIAVPSFFLGTALGVSSTETAILIFVAIMLHKSSAAFALALKMVRSTLTPMQAWAVFTAFALSTPLGIVVGEEVHQLVGPQAMLVIKGTVLGMAAGTFLYMATLHELRHAPMITSCATRRGFVLMLTGFALTVVVRLLIGEAHSIGG